MYSPKIESSKIDGCRQPLSISIRQQDDVPILYKCRIAASQESTNAISFVGPYSDAPQHSCCSDPLRRVLQGPNCLPHLDLLLFVWKHSNDRLSCILTRDARRRKMQKLFQQELLLLWCGGTFNIVKLSSDHRIGVQYHHLLRHGLSC